LGSFGIFHDDDRFSHSRVRSRAFRGGGPTDPSALGSIVTFRERSSFRPNAASRVEEPSAKGGACSEGASRARHGFKFLILSQEPGIVEPLVFVVLWSNLTFSLLLANPLIFLH
jgi:hypothetical protein